MLLELQHTSIKSNQTQQSSLIQQQYVVSYD
jgi:hypothetical protein